MRSSTTIMFMITITLLLSFIITFTSANNTQLSNSQGDSNLTIQWAPIRRQSSWLNFTVSNIPLNGGLTYIVSMTIKGIKLLPVQPGHVLHTASAWMKVSGAGNYDIFHDLSQLIHIEDDTAYFQFKCWFGNDPGSRGFDDLRVDFSFPVASILIVSRTSISTSFQSLETGATYSTPMPLSPDNQYPFSMYQRLQLIPLTPPKPFHRTIKLEMQDIKVYPEHSSWGVKFNSTLLNSNPFYWIDMSKNNTCAATPSWGEPYEQGTFINDYAYDFEFFYHYLNKWQVGHNITLSCTNLAINLENPIWQNGPIHATFERTYINGHYIWFQEGLYSDGYTFDPIQSDDDGTTILVGNQQTIFNNNYSPMKRIHINQNGF